MHLPSISTLLQLSISVASAMLDVILLVLCGVLLRQVSLLDRNTTRKMSALLFHIIGPSFQFLKCARAFSLDAMKLMWICPIMALVYLLLGHLIANVVFINQKGLRKKIPVMASTFTNFSSLPFVFVKALIKSGVFRGETQEILEERAMGYISMFLAPNSIVMFSYGFLYLSLTSEELKRLFRVFSRSKNKENAPEGDINSLKLGHEKLESPPDDEGDEISMKEISIQQQQKMDAATPEENNSDFISLTVKADDDNTAKQEGNLESALASPPSTMSMDEQVSESPLLATKESNFSTDDLAGTDASNPAGTSPDPMVEDPDVTSSYSSESRRVSLTDDRPSTSHTNRTRKHLHTLGRALAFSYRRIITPPLIAIGIAFLLSLHPTVKKNIIMEPPLFVSSIIHTLETISGGFFAFCMFILGANLSTSIFSSPPSDTSSSTGRRSIWQKCCPNFLWRFHTNIVKRYLLKFNSYSTLFLTIMVKMVILPIIAMVIVNLLVFFNIINSDPVLILVLLLESATPCALTMVVLCNLAGDRGVEQMSEITFWMYVVSPFTLLIWTSIFLANGCAYAPDMCV